MEINIFFVPQIDDTEVINFLLSTEIIPLCLKTMEMGSELSKTVATFIVQKILIDQVCAARFSCMLLECEARIALVGWGSMLRFAGAMARCTGALDVRRVTITATI